MQAALELVDLLIIVGWQDLAGYWTKRRVLAVCCRLAVHSHSMAYTIRCS